MQCTYTVHYTVYTIQYKLHYTVYVRCTLNCTTHVISQGAALLPGNHVHYIGHNTYDV